ncbi:MAG: S-layer glycoprotein N-glycosyltransferase AglJ [Methanospirillaceae archaeon]|nr:S-layer glycoprotein N-glycosyltransferase AglJ [Methanospirillaceae archaeon]
MDINRDNVCILIPTLNEEPTIGLLISEFKGMGFSDILVIDGNSTDKTQELAEKAGARVVIQKGKGKGTAVIQAFSLIEKPYILMVDGDGTYSPDDAIPMLEPLLTGSDQVIGNRLTHTNVSAISRLNRTGNYILNNLFKMGHGVYYYDILSGYRAFTKESIQKMHLSETGFGIETELISEAVRIGACVTVVPVSYGKRPGTKTKLRPIKDGCRIAKTIYRLARVNNPLFYFGFVGLILMITGIGMGIYVMIEWFARIDHLPLTILAVTFVMFGFQIFMFGVLADMIVSFHREVINEIQKK